MLTFDREFAGVRVTIRTDAPELLALLDKDTAPFFAPTSQDGNWQGPHLLLDLLSVGGERTEVPEGAEPVLLHPRDTPLYGALWQEGDVRCIWNPHYPARYEIREDQAVVWYEEDSFNAFVAYRLLVFPLIYRLADREGALSFHASAVERNNRAYLFCGPKGAGKTTAALSLALASGFGFLSNDYTTLLPDGTGGVTVLGPPEAIRVGEGTYQALRDWLRDFDDVDVVKGKRLILLRNLAGQLRLVKEAPLAEIVLVHLVPEGELQKEALSTEEAATALLPYAMEVDGYGIPQLWQPLERLPQEEIERRIGDLVAGVPICRLTVPFRAVGDPSLAAALLQRIESETEYTS